MTKSFIAGMIDKYGSWDVEGASIVTREYALTFQDGWKTDCPEWADVDFSRYPYWVLYDDDSRKPEGYVSLYDAFDEFDCFDPEEDADYIGY